MLTAPASAEAPAEKSPWITVLEAEILGGYSEVEGHEGTFSSIDSWLFSPTLRVNDSLYWINIYNGSFNRSAQVVAQEEGGRQTNTTQSHNLTTSLKYNINETWSLRPMLFANWTFVNEIDDEDLGEGLYDYQDLGAGIESAWVTFQSREKREENRLGFRFIDRSYPNYRSLLSSFSPSAAETDEKDLRGYKINLAHDTLVAEGWSWGVEGAFFYKDYTDKKTINQNGVLQSGGREDFVEYANAYISRPLSREWTFRLDGQFSINTSNLDFYDTHNTATFADDNFIKDYYSFFSFLAKPALIYRRSLAEEKDLVVAADYTFYALHYPGRKVQNTAGVYQADDQQDYAHTFSGKVSYPLTRNFSWVTFGSYTTADSNQDFENFYLYTYDSWTAVTGISLKY